MRRRGHAPSLMAALVFAQEEADTAVCISPDGLLLTCAHCLVETADAFDLSRSHWLLFASFQVVEARRLTRPRPLEDRSSPTNTLITSIINIKEGPLSV
ncbi:hypothetical protein CTA2_11480 [Colletotrichum tanaceti]|nr:hypothetical protein CTA2_11480 [Colletotrichum tanaceti]